MKDDLAWEKREITVAGPGSNRSRAKARRQAKRRGNKRARMTVYLSVADEL